MKNRRFLFISHNATRTGAPIELLRFLRWFKENTDHDFLVLLERGGDLEQDFSDLADTKVWKRPLNTENRVIRKIQELFRIEGIANLVRGCRIRRWCKKYQITLVYANTAFTGESLDLLSFLQCPKVCRLHELEFIIRNFRYPHGYNSFVKTRRICEKFIAVSRAVKNNLVAGHGIPAHGIEIVHGSIVPVNRKKYLNPRRMGKLKADLGISPDETVIGGSGWLEWRKGPDLFIQIAGVVKKSFPQYRFRFLWVGGDLTTPFFKKLKHDMLNLGVEDMVTFAGHTADPFSFYALFDMLAMTSREDPFPLVNMEAGFLGKPAVCFENSGGSVEWVGRGCGLSVPYLDVRGFAEKIVYLIEHAEEMAEMSANCVRQATDLLTENNNPRVYQWLQKWQKNE